MLYIEFVRRERGWSQKALGDACRIHQTFISMIERSVGLPAPDQLDRLSQALNIPPEMVLAPVVLPEIPTEVGARG